MTTIAFGRVGSESARLRNHAAVLCHVSGGSPRKPQSMKKQGPPPCGMNSVGSRDWSSSFADALFPQEGVIIVSQPKWRECYRRDPAAFLLLRAPKLDAPSQRQPHATKRDSGRSPS